MHTNYYLAQKVKYRKGINHVLHQFLHTFRDVMKMSLALSQTEFTSGNIEHCHLPRLFTFLIVAPPLPITFL